MVSESGKSCFLELNRHSAALLVVQPLEPGVCPLGDFTGCFLPRDWCKGVKKRSTSAGPLAIMCKVSVL